MNTKQRNTFPRKTNEKLFSVFILIKWHTLFMLVYIFFLFGINIFAETHVENERAFLKNIYFKVEKFRLKEMKKITLHMFYITQFLLYLFFLFESDKLYFTIQVYIKIYRILIYMFVSLSERCVPEMKNTKIKINIKKVEQ